MVYSFYDPDHAGRSGLGNYIILDHIRRTVEMGLPYVYLGYWVDGSASMQYKIRYRPLEKLGQNGWERFAPEEQDQLIADIATQRAIPLSVESHGKDGLSDAQEFYRLVD